MGKRFSACAVVVCALSTVLSAEVQVNVRTSGAQANPAVAVDGLGGSVVVWSSYFTTAGRSNDILARRLDAGGAFASDEFQVNVVKEGNQTEPAVAMGRDGRFAVVWQGPGLDVEDIFLRLFDPNGSPVTDELLVNSLTGGRQLCPSIARSEGGTLVVAWESREVVEDVNVTFVRARVFDPNAVALGEDFIVDANVSDCRYPTVATDGMGDFLITWQQQRGDNAIMARLFDPNAVPATEPFEVSTAAITSLTQPTVAMNSAGYFVIAWDGDPNRAGDDDIHARRFDPNAMAIGEPFVVNTIRDKAQRWPQVALNDANEFAVIWEQEMEDPNLATDIFIRRFDAAGQPAGEPEQLNTYVQDKQRYPDIAMRADGSFVAVWESNDQDGSGYGIFARLEPPDPAVAARKD